MNQLQCGQNSSSHYVINQAGSDKSPNHPMRRKSDLKRRKEDSLTEILIKKIVEPVEEKRKPVSTKNIPPSYRSVKKPQNPDSATGYVWNLCDVIYKHNTPDDEEMLHLVMEISELRHIKRTTSKQMFYTWKNLRDRDFKKRK